MEAIAYLVAALFAVNIGASGAAAAMGHVYGARALRVRIVALGLAAAAMLSGAVFAGSPVTETLSADLAPGADVTAVIALMVLISATGPLLLANLLGLPLSTSAVTVGAIAGLGIAAGSIDGGVAGAIGLWWVVLPAASFSLSALGTRVLQRSGLQKRLLRSKRTRSAMALVLVAGGIYVAFGVGANNVSNAIAPLLGAGLLESPTALVLGGIALAIGAVALGGRVLRTNALRFATLDMTTGSLVAFVSGSLILAASLCGLSGGAGASGNVRHPRRRVRAAGCSRAAPPAHARPRDCVGRIAGGVAGPGLPPHQLGVRREPCRALGSVRDSGSRRAIRAGRAVHPESAAPTPCGKRLARAAARPQTRRRDRPGHVDPIGEREEHRRAYRARSHDRSRIGRRQQAPQRRSAAGSPALGHRTLRHRMSR